MTIKSRFGRNLSLPSTKQIIHELKMFAEYDDARLACAKIVGAPDNATWQEIRDRRLQMSPENNVGSHAESTSD